MFDPWQAKDEDDYPGWPRKRSNALFALVLILGPAIALLVSMLFLVYVRDR